MESLKDTLETIVAAIAIITAFYKCVIAIYERRALVGTLPSHLGNGILCLDAAFKTRAGVQFIWTCVVFAFLITTLLGSTTMYQLAVTGHSFDYSFAWFALTASSPVPFAYAALRN